MTYPPIETTGAEQARPGVVHAEADAGSGLSVRGATTTSAVRVPGLAELQDQDYYAIVVPFGGRRCAESCGRPLGEQFDDHAFDAHLSVMPRPLEVPVTAGHSTTVVGRAVAAVPIPGVGLTAMIRLAATAEGHAAADLIDRGRRAASIGFHPLREEPGDWGVRIVKQALWDHVGLAMNEFDQGAYPEAQLFDSMSELYTAAKAWPVQGQHPDVVAARAAVRERQARRGLNRAVERGEITVEQALARI